MTHAIGSQAVATIGEGADAVQRTGKIKDRTANKDGTVLYLLVDEEGSVWCKHSQLKVDKAAPGGET